MASLILEQAKMYPRLKNAYKSFEESGLLTVSNCKTRMNHLEKLWSTYEQNNMSIIAHKDFNSLQEQPYIKDDHFSCVEEHYIQNMCKFQTFMDSNSSNGNSDQPLPRSQIVTLENERLPPLNIPHFSGDYTKWESFRDIFVSSVINRKNYSNVAKLHQLISVLEGDAATIAASYQPTDANFLIVWDKLKERYEIKKRLVHAHIANMYSLKPMTKSSASELKKILSGINTPLSALRGLGRDVDHWDDLVVFHVLSLLDIDSRRHWETYLNNYCNNLPPPVALVLNNASVPAKASSEPPTLAKLLEFIENQINILESLEDSNRSNLNQQNLNITKNINSGNSAKVFNTTVQKPSNSHQNSKNNSNECIICNANHFFLFCSDYKNKSPKQREELVARKKRCFNCLGPHFISDCKSTKRCTICKNKHHTSLHIKGYKKSNNANITNTEAQPIANTSNKEVTVPGTAALSTSS